MSFPLLPRLSCLLILGCATSGLASCQEAKNAGPRQDGDAAAAVWPELPENPGDALRVMTYVPQQAPEDAVSAALADLIAHLPASYGAAYHDADATQWGHETSHGLSMHLRRNDNHTGRVANGFYLMNDRAVVVAEPTFHRADAAPFIPASLRGPLFDLYITGAGPYGNTPLYVVDELTASINGLLVAIDVATPNNAAEALPELAAYALGIARATQALDPDFFRTYPPFAGLIAHEVERALALVRTAQPLPFFAASAAKTKASYLKLQTDPTLRAFAAALFGQAWDARVLGASIGATPPAESAPSAADGDHDSIRDELDRCPATPAGQAAWRYGEFIGCATGEQPKA